MNYISHIPAPPLDAYIYDLYYIDGRSPYPRLKVSPDAMLHLMVNLGRPFEVYAPNQATSFATCSESWWIGLWSQYWIVDWSQPVQFYGVHFKPAGLTRILWNLPDTAQPNIWSCAAASMTKTQIIP
jgi:hypothetical protein